MTIPLLTNPVTQGPKFLVEQQVNVMAQLWNDIGSASDITITGGNIDGTIIGATSAASGKFTNLTTTGTVDLHLSTLVLNAGQISGNYVSGGAITNVSVVLTADPVSDMQAATKQYVDNAVTGVGSLSEVAHSGSYTDLTDTPSFGSLAFLGSVAYSNIQDETANTILGNDSGVTGVVREIALISTAFTFLKAANVGAMQNAINLGTTNQVQFYSLALSSASLAVSAQPAGNIQIANTATFKAEYDNGSKVANFAIDWTKCQKQKVTLAGSTLTMTFVAPAGPGHFQLKIAQDGTGSRIKGTWPTILTPGGGSSSWVLSTAASAVDILNLYYDGTNWYGQLTTSWS